ncbi:ATP-dependent RNA helicase DDX24 [Operophtera brumata]|uniref:ATP-dependent RNA helicase DDX24 n=1 Tax=Operophtera brumata TaxID=104452 RepID=A0A0L7L4Z2_OPEBR|nr:ATP-dependent RNA helicase DDX24 [Operophtera brumata]
MEHKDAHLLYILKRHPGRTIVFSSGGNVITCAMEHKDAYLLYILKRHPGRTIVFCNSIGSVRR